MPRTSRRPPARPRRRRGGRAARRGGAGGGRPRRGTGGGFPRPRRAAEGGDEPGGTTRCSAAMVSPRRRAEPRVEVPADAREAETRALGRALAAELAPDGVLLLTGDLAAGKTVLAQGIAEGLGIAAAEVQSPTFTLVREHRGPGGRLVHLDLYRLDADDLPALARRRAARRPRGQGGGVGRTPAVRLAPGRCASHLARRRRRSGTAHRRGGTVDPVRPGAVAAPSARNPSTRQPGEEAAMKIRKIGVLGCGLMGLRDRRGVRPRRLPTVVREVTEDLLEQGHGAHPQVARQGRCEKGKLDADDREEALGRLGRHRRARRPRRVRPGDRGDRREPRGEAQDAARPSTRSSTPGRCWPATPRR